MKFIVVERFDWGVVSNPYGSGIGPSLAGKSCCHHPVGEQ
jgi:hypothetical protein